MLKKVIDKEKEIKPINIYAIPHGEGVNGICPTCGTTVNCYSNYEKCNVCKQKLKWR